MRIESAFVFFAAAVGMLPCFATTYYVSAKYGDDTNGDGSAATPYATIAKGYTAAANVGDEVVVSNGTYTVTSAMTIGRGVTVRGLTGNPEDIIVKASGKFCPVFFMNHANALLTGVVVTDVAGRRYGGIGGGIAFDTSGGTVSNCVIRNCHFISGDSTAGGAGVGFMKNVYKGLLTHSVISNCYDAGNNPVSGALQMESGGTVRNCLIVKNAYSFKEAYGTVMIKGGTLENCTIADNYAGKGYAGVWATGGTVRNCLIANNLSMNADPARAVWAGTASKFTNCVSDVAAINDWCHCVTNVFVDPSRGDYSPKPGSLPVDLGADQTWMTDATDLAGNPRIRGTHSDIGCYEIPSGFSAVYTASSGYCLFTNEVTTFTVLASPVGAQGLRCKWDWDGDGTYDETVDGATATHHFSTEGTYRISARVEDLSSSAVCYTPTKAYVAYPKCYYFSKTGSNTAPYTTPATAATSLSAAVASAVPGSEVIVLKNTYTQSAEFTLSKGVTIRGETGNPADVVIASNGGGHRLFTLNNADACIAGISIANAAMKAGGQMGSGMRITEAGGTVSNCVFRGCYLKDGDTGLGGGGIGIESGGWRALVTHSVFSNCWDNSWYDASAHRPGGGAILMKAGHVRNCLFLKNTFETSRASPYGIVHIDDGLLENCTLADNFAGAQCSGVWALGGTVRNCLIAGNTTSSSDNPEYAVWAGKAKYFTNCVSDVSAITDTCFYCESPYAGQATGDYRPAPGSVPVNRGVNQTWMYAATDIEGNDRIRSSVVDVGCYEIDADSFSATFTMSSGTYGFANETIVVTVAPSVIGELGTQCEWDWDGDGVYDETTYGTVTSHVFTAYGTHNVSARVTDLSSGRSCLTSVLAFPVYPRVVWVSKTGTETEPYDTRETAATTLATAYGAAVDGTVIKLVADTYSWSSFTIAKGVTVCGETGDPEDVVVSGGSAQRVFTLNHADACLAGLAVTGGWIKQFDAVGAGIWIASNGGTVSNCVIRNCSLAGGDHGKGGGGVAIDSSYGLLTHSVISNCWDSSIAGDTAPRGGALLIRAGMARNCLFARNANGVSGTSPYGTVCLEGGSLENCTIAGNSAGSCCPGVWAAPQSGSSVSVVNCLIASNTTTSSSAALAAYAGTASSFNNCVSDAVVINDSCVLARRAFKHSDRGDYHSAQASPAVNGGLLRPWMDGATDLDGKPRIQGPRPDIGCYERDRHGLAVIYR